MTTVETPDSIDDGSDSSPDSSRALRPLRPSRREAALLGDDVSSAPIQAAQWDEPVVKGESALSRLRRVFATLNPRSVADGQPMFPLIILTLLAAMTTWDVYGFQALLPVIRLDMKFDFSFMLALTGVLGFFMTVLSPATGYLADRIKRVWMTRVGASVICLSAILSALAGAPGLLILGRLGAGLGQSIELPARLPLLADYYAEKSRPRVFSFMTLGTTLGPLIAITMTVTLVYRMGVNWRVVLLPPAVLTIALVAALFFLREPGRGDFERLSAGLSEEEAAQQPKPVGWAEAWRTLSSIATLKRMWYATPFLTVAQYGLGGFLYFAFAAKAQRLVAGGGGWGASIFATSYAPYLFFGVPVLIATIGIAFSAPVADRLMRQRPGKIMVFMGGVLAMQALSTLFFIATPWLLPAILFLFLSNGISALTLPAQYTLLAAIVPARVRGIGLQSSAPWQLLGFLLLPIVGSIADHYGPIAGVYWLIPIYLAGALILASSGASVAADIRAATAASAADVEASDARRRGAAKMIVCRDVDVAYEGTHVLHAVDFDVAEGDLVAILGTNGAGKSTLLKAICGLEHASNGAVFLDGEDVTHKPPYLNAREGIVYVPGGRAVFPTLTVAENLRVGLAGRHAAAAGADAEHGADVDADHSSGPDVDLEELHALFPILRARADAIAGNLSGGEQQMVALAQAFLMRPRLLMIDELSLGLAPSVVEPLIQAVRRIHERGTTVLLVEQSLNVAVTIAERAVFMEKGRIVFDGPTGDLLKRPDLVRAVFMGGAGAAVLSRAVRPSTDEEAGPALVLEDVGVSFGGVAALRGVSLTAKPGEIVGIIGPNGAGKTTLLDIVSGFVPPDRGIVRIGGEDVTRTSPDERARLGLSRSFQNPRLFRSLTVSENIAVAFQRRAENHSPLASAAWLPGARKSETRTARRVDQLVETLGLGAFANKFVEELSTGSRRMVDLACILAAEPTVLLLDEPSSGLAQAETDLLAPTVQRLVSATGCAAVVIEHDIPLVSAMADRLVAMELGTVLVEGTPEAVLADDRVVSSYLNASESVIQRSGQLAGVLNALAGPRRR
ncbi:MAG: hypothetical protein QOI20_2085 [Acidimicrobiaceae bacterium]|jgi:branched-chain amino acid transport system ATP-binding protein|nr:hypothetical protein [Acidimicrobiaceae bacterium]